MVLFNLFRPREGYKVGKLNVLKHIARFGFKFGITRKLRVQDKKDGVLVRLVFPLL